MIYYMIIASQFATQHKQEVALVKNMYKIVKSFIKVLDLGWSLVL